MIKLIEQLLEKRYYRLAKAVVTAYKSEPSVHFSSRTLHVSVDTHKSVDAPTVEMLDLTPDRATLVAKLEDVKKPHDEMEKEVSERVMQVQDVFESLVDGITIDAADEYNKRIAKLFE